VGKPKGMSKFMGGDGLNAGLLHILAARAPLGEGEVQAHAVLNPVKGPAKVQHMGAGVFNNNANSAAVLNAGAPSRKNNPRVFDPGSVHMLFYPGSCRLIIIGWVFPADRDCRAIPNGRFKNVEVRFRGYDRLLTKGNS
jgi:hypothetical protein